MASGTWPWAKGTSATSATTAATRRFMIIWTKERPPRSRSGRRDAARRWLRQREHEQAVAALEVELRVTARRYRDVLLAVDHVRHRWRIRAGTDVELPQLLAGARVERPEPAVAFAVEDDVA